MIENKILKKAEAIPLDWDVKSLGNIAEIIMGQSPSSSSYNDEGVGKLLIQGNADIDNRKTSPRTWTSEITKQCNVGDIIMTVRAPVGAIAKSLHDACIGRGVCAIRSEDVNMEFLYQFLINYESSWKSLEQGSTFTAVNGRDIRGIKVNLPAKSEQKKIAEILSTVDEKIEVIEEKIAKTQELKKGLMQQLLTRGIGHTEFKDSPLGTIPFDWEVKELNEVSDITRLAGYEYSEYWKEDPDGKIMTLRGFNIGKNKLILKDIVRISEELSQKLIRSRLFKGDVVFPCVGTIGNAVVIEEDDKFHINQNIAKISPHQTLNSYYLSQYLTSDLCRNEINRFNATTSQPNVLVGSLRKFRIPVPKSIEEQKLIAGIFTEVDEKIGILEQKKNAYSELKMGLMQQLLTGKIRVTNRLLKEAIA